MINKFNQIKSSKGIIYTIFAVAIPLGIPTIIIYETIKNRKALIKKFKNIWKK